MICCLCEGKLVLGGRYCFALRMEVELVGPRDSGLLGLAPGPVLFDSA